jgi:peptidoglycan/xylan/chitin deacetylase (PgdA/CDA1 family)
LKTLLIVILCFLLVGCAGTAVIPADNTYENPDDEPDYADEAPTSTEPDEEVQDELDLDAIRPNEAGKVMVLMYHEIGGEEATWTRTAENFRQDMLTLYENDYRPINLGDFLRGHIDIPAGTTPFILTFDDGTAGQFRFIEEDGETIIDPDCAVGILLNMAETYEDFSPAGTFYIYYPLPFRQRAHIEEKLELLNAWGFEIGNHAYNHENLGKVSRDEAIKSLAKHVQATQTILSDYQVNSLALPYGAQPKDNSYIISGTWEGITYKNDAILLVGANPAPSPFHTNFNPYRIPRIRADSTELPRWLEHFENKREERYISDGDPNIITVPESLADQIDENRLGDRTLRLY